MGSNALSKSFLWESSKQKVAYNNLTAARPSSVDLDRSCTDFVGNKFAAGSFLRHMPYFDTVDQNLALHVLSIKKYFCSCTVIFLTVFKYLFVLNFLQSPFVFLFIMVVDSVAHVPVWDKTSGTVCFGDLETRQGRRVATAHALRSTL